MIYPHHKFYISDTTKVNCESKMSLINTCLIATLTLQCIAPVRSERILLLAHLQGSHVMQITTSGQELMRRGHDVYVVLPTGSSLTSMVQKKGLKLLTFQVANNEGLMESPDYNILFEEDVFKDDFDISVTLDPTMSACFKHCDLMLHDLEFMAKVKLLDFDFAIVDLFILGSCLALLPHHLKIPFAAESDSIQNIDIGVPNLPSFMPSYSQQATDRMSFSEKLTSLFLMIVFSTPFSVTERNTTLLNEFAPALSSWRQLRKQAHLYVIHRDYLLEYPSPTMPHVVTTAGVNFAPSKPLLPELSRQLKWTNDIVVMSFGSSAGKMPEKFVRVFIDAFRQFPDYAFVWKLPNADKYTLPKNIIASPWLPQNDLMAVLPLTFRRKKV